MLQTTSRGNPRFFKMHGITLLELMIVVVIVAVLAAIAVPSYRNQMLRAQRSDATAALLRVAAAQEKFYLQNNTYTTNPADLRLTNVSEHGWYSIALSAHPNFAGDLTRGFRATATAAAGGAQFADTQCRVFTTDHTGAKTAVNSGGADNSATCWNR